jgi:fucose permease
MSEKTPSLREKPESLRLEPTRSRRSLKSPPLEHALERLNSMCSANIPMEGTDPMAAGPGAARIRKRGVHDHYYFDRLAREVPLPGRALEWAMIATLFLVMFLAGWNDGSQGPLLPSLQRYYNVDYLVISIIWLFNSLGFMAAGLSNVWLSDRFGFGIVAPFGAALQALAYALICWGGPYPLFVFAFVLIGWGLGLQDAQVNSIVSRMQNANTLMFLMHAVYGLGATASPLVSTQFVKRVQSRVYLYYAVSLGLAVATTAALLLVFRLRTEDQVVGKRSAEAPTPPPEPTNEHGEVLPIELQPQHHPDAPPHPEAEAEAGRMSVSTAPDLKYEDSSAKLKRILRKPSVWGLCFYILLYVGVEVTIGGWATSFLIAERNGDDSSGYVSSGFFAGLTLGRVILIPVTSWMGRSNSVWVYTFGAIAMEVVVWTTTSLVGNAVAYAIAGIFLGPMYPIVMMVTVGILPPDLHQGAIGMVASLGQVGSAIMPFITGSIANTRGVWILQPLMIAFMGASLVIWAFVPRERKGWHA